MSRTAGDIRKVVAQPIDIGRSVSACVLVRLRLRAGGVSHGTLLVGGGAPSAPAI